MFKRWIENIPKDCSVYINGQRIDDLRKLKAGRFDSVFFVDFNPQVVCFKCSARSQEMLPVEGEIRFSVGIENDEPKINKWFKEVGLPTYPNIRTLSVKNFIPIIEQNLEAQYIAFAKKKQFIDLVSNDHTEEFSLVCSRLKFGEWVIFKVVSLVFEDKHYEEERKKDEEKNDKIAAIKREKELDEFSEKKKTELEEVRKKLNADLQMASKKYQDQIDDLEEKQNERRRKEELRMIDHKNELTNREIKNSLDNEKLEAESKFKIKMEELDFRRKQAEVMAKEVEIQNKSLNEWAKVLSAMKGLYIPDYSGAHTIISGGNGVEKNELLEPVLNAVLTKFLETEGKTLPKTKYGA